MIICRKDGRSRHPVARDIRTSLYSIHVNRASRRDVEISTSLYSTKGAKKSMDKQRLKPGVQEVYEFSGFRGAPE